MIKKITYAIIASMLLVGAVGCEKKVNNTEIESNGKEVKSELGNLNNGEYEGNGKGYNGDVKVKVIIKNNKIDGINILSNEDDKEYFEEAKILIPNIIKKQSTKVDTISGATRSSVGIIKAVENALTKAK